MARPKQDTKHINARIPSYMYNVLVQYQEKMGYNTITQALVDVIAGGINWVMVMEEDNDTE